MWLICGIVIGAFVMRACSSHELSAHVAAHKKTLARARFAETMADNYYQNLMVEKRKVNRKPKAPVFSIVNGGKNA